MMNHDRVPRGILVTVILLAAAVLSSMSDSVNYKAVVRPGSAVFEFPVQYDTTWTISNTKPPAPSPEYEWTVSTMVADTLFSFGYVFGDRQLLINGIVDRAVVVDVAFEPSRVVVRLNDTSAIRRIFARRPGSIQFSNRLPGRSRETIDVAVEYAEAFASNVPTETDAQQRVEILDSTYLRLVLDLADAGTFTYVLLSRESQVNIFREIRDVDVDGCTLAFQVWVQQIAQGSQSRIPRNFYETTVAIPLDAIDARSLTIRATHPRGNARYDPQPWLLHMAVKPDTNARILVGSLESSHKRPTRNFDLPVEDHQTATLVKGWLIDSANRCKTWKTTPLKPIR